MQVYGSSQNLVSFREYGLKLLEEARMDYMKALPHVEIYLGAVFRSEAEVALVHQIFDTEIDTCRELCGEEGVKNRIKSYFFQELGHIIRQFYLPKESPRWEDLKKMLGYEPDFNEYYSRLTLQKYFPAGEMIAQLFDRAINGQRRITIKEVCSASLWYHPQLGREVKVPGQIKHLRTNINPHLWRKWFYSLWGQEYEWGCFKVDEKTALADGLLYSFAVPPQVINRMNYVPVRELLEANGFKLSFDNDGRVEYWR